MRVLWPTVVAPLLVASRPATIIEFGPQEDAFGGLLDGIARELGGAIVRPAELTGLAASPDFALIHGEPNWHSVSDRLERLTEMARSRDADFPLTVVHGIDWPTGRRDFYPEPSSIPVPAPQSHGEEGVERALERHELRNGVLTAVEDFLREDGSGLELVHVPGLGGIAILFSERRLQGDRSRQLAELIDEWRLSPQARAQLATIDAERVRASAEGDRLREELEAARAGVETQGAAAEAELLGRIEELAARVVALTEALARRDARLAVLEGEEESVAASPMPNLVPDTEATLGDLSQALPLDRRGILLAPGEEPPPETEALDAIVHLRGGAEELRRCLWSLLARVDRPLRLTLVTGPDTSPAAESLARAIDRIEPAVRLAEAELEEDVSATRLLVERPVEFATGSIRRLLRAAAGAGAPVAPASAAALGMPSWAGPEALSILLDAESAAGAPSLAAPCTAMPPGVAAGAPGAVALDAIACEGGGTGVEPEARLRDALADEATLAATLRKRQHRPLSVAYVLPGLPAEGSGGSDSIFQEARALRAIGVPIKVLVESDFTDRAASLYPEAAEMIVSYGSPRGFEAALTGVDVVVATEAPSARLVEAHVRAHDGVLGAYYVQDYEPFFSPAGGPSADTALLSYRQAEGLLMFAKTHWIANTIGAAHHIPVAKVNASLDRSAFHRRGRRTEADPVRVVAMIRPRTPRRRPEATLATLAQIKAELGERVECLGFGCSGAELDSLPAAEGVEHLGVLSRTDVGEVLRRCDVFLDLSGHQAFGRTGLQAIACGAVPVLPRAGGAIEYAEHEVNALLVDSEDADEVLAAALGLVEDPDRLERLRAGGAETPERFSLIRAAASQYACFAEASAALRGKRT